MENSIFELILYTVFLVFVSYSMGCLVNLHGIEFVSNYNGLDFYFEHYLESGENYIINTRQHRDKNNYDYDDERIRLQSQISQSLLRCQTAYYLIKDSEKSQFLRDGILLCLYLTFFYGIITDALKYEALLILRILFAVLIVAGFAFSFFYNLLYKVKDFVFTSEESVISLINSVLSNSSETHMAESEKIAVKKEDMDADIIFKYYYGFFLHDNLNKLKTLLNVKNTVIVVLIIVLISVTMH